MKTSELRDLFGVSESAVSRWVTSGWLPQGECWIKTPGGRLLFRRTYIERLLAGS
jgi:predicted site-specific integrase-resolvase